MASKHRILFDIEPVATPAERSRRRTFRIWLAVVLFVFGGAFWLTTRTKAPLVIVAVFSAVALGNIALAWNAAQLSGLNWSARRKLRESRYRLCHNCSYDLAVLAESGRCPECGAEYNPDLLRAKWEASYKRMLEKPLP